jgi:hypothetical protein
LQAIARNLQNGLNEGLNIMMDWASVSGDIEVDVNSAFEIKITNESELSSLLGMRQSRDLSRESLWVEFKRRGVLRDEFDNAEEAALLGAEEPLFGMFGGEEGE